MKKQIAIIATTIIVVLIAVIFLLTSSGTIKDENVINELKQNSNLDIIVNLGNYSYDEYNESKLLDVSMQIAEKLGLLNEDSSNDNYIQYVSENDLHLIIYELTGITVEAPIEIEDYYYLYDSENEYYYYRPASPSYFSVNEIKSVKENNSNYNIICSTSKTEDLDVTTFNNVELSLTHMPDNSLVKYRVNEIICEN